MRSVPVLSQAVHLIKLDQGIASTVCLWHDIAFWLKKMSLNGTKSEKRRTNVFLPQLWDYIIFI